MFEKESGQVFREWTMTARLPSIGGLDWSRKQPFNYQKPPNVHGARSLVDMAISSVAKNAGLLTKHHLEPLPARLLWRLWRFLEVRGVCLQAWTVFSQMLSGDDVDRTLGLYRFRQHICRPEDELKLYTQPLSSASVQFITHITISGDCVFTAPELLALADMKNLGVLELIKPSDGMQMAYPQINDRLIRGWTDAEDPFPQLRILKIWGHQTVTQASLRWASMFPALVLYDIMGAQDDWNSVYEAASSTGWRVSEHVTRNDDSSILRSLLLLLPSDAQPTQRISSLCRSIDTDLISLCCDSRCALKLVPHGEAPQLLDYLTDPAKVTKQHSWNPDTALREVKFCHGIAFEAWAFWLYSLIGQLSDDRDLEQEGHDFYGSGKQAIAGPFVLPSRPMASLFLGHSGRDGISSKPSYISQGLFSTRRFTFTRPTIMSGKTAVRKSAATEKGQGAPASKPREPSLKANKKRRLDDILSSFT